MNINKVSFNLNIFIRKMLIAKLYHIWKVYHIWKYTIFGSYIGMYTVFGCMACLEAIPYIFGMYTIFGCIWCL